jgi:hypothetical protein
MIANFQTGFTVKQAAQLNHPNPARRDDAPILNGDYNDV